MFFKRSAMWLLCLGFFNLWAVDTKIEVPLSEKGERHIIILTCSYNNAQYCIRNLDSVFEQRYENYHVIYINDCSEDNTLELVKSHIEKRGMEDRVLIIDNEVRRGALYNQYHAIHELCEDTDLVVILDGDDWFYGPDVLSFVHSVYNDPNVWLTYGQFAVYPSGGRGWCVDMPRRIVENNAFRSFEHNPSHLRTFYAGLFKQIKKEDLMYEGEFFKMAPDNAAMFPMIEMARDGHFQFIRKELLVWNGENNLNEHKVIPGLQRKMDVIIRSLPRYNKIETPFLTTPAA